MVMGRPRVQRAIMQDACREAFKSRQVYLTREVLAPILGADHRNVINFLLRSAWPATEANIDRARLLCAALHVPVEKAYRLLTPEEEQSQEEQARVGTLPPIKAGPNSKNLEDAAKRA